MEDGIHTKHTSRVIIVLRYHDRLRHRSFRCSKAVSKGVIHRICVFYYFLILHTKVFVTWSSACMVFKTIEEKEEEKTYLFHLYFISK